MIRGSRGSTDGLQNTYRLDNKGFEYWQEEEIFSSPKPVQLVLRPIQHPIQSVLWFLPSDKAAVA
jgi:hypothetical protein